MTGLIALAARAPSLHNSQPWRFRIDGSAVELRADPDRQLWLTDPDGREMLISCGAALYGLRLGLRRLGFQPVTEVLPDPAQPALIARVRAGQRERPSGDERDMIAAVPHRHTHRGPFGPGRVPEHLLDDLVHDAAAEGADLVLLSAPGQIHGLARLTAEASRAQLATQEKIAEARSWVRSVGSTARDGVPARARTGSERLLASGRPEEPAHERLPGRDFGLPGDLPVVGGALPSATAVLTTTGDEPGDWLRAGQALHRMLLRAAGRWVFASLQSQPLESPDLRAAIRDYLGLSGRPQLLLQFGRANTAAATPRRPVAEIIDHGTIDYGQPAPGQRL
jgi:nitroreductase